MNATTLQREANQPVMPLSKKPVLQLSGITKAFHGVVALNNVDLDILPGEVHVLVGENGAGKSTLIKIISGLYKKDSGTYTFDSKEVSLNSPNHAKKLGISTVYQELTLAPELSVAENIFLGKLPKTSLGTVNWKKVFSDARELLDELDIDISPKTKVAKLSVGFRQMVEIARALSINSKVVIFDEPTAVLTDKESKILFRNILKLREKGVGIIYISHRIAEVLDLADRITVLRDGNKIETVDTKGVKYDDIVRMMVGRNVMQNEARPNISSQPFAKIEGFSTSSSKVKNVSFTINKGEILGVYGLVGSGRTEMARLIFGLDKKKSGNLYIEGEKVEIDSPSKAKEIGMGFIPEDRRFEGLVLELDVSKNLCLANHKEISNMCFLSSKKEYDMTEKGIKSISIKTSNHKQKVINLSGGNQQKVVMARWLARFPKLKFLIMDEPTRGVDVGAKAEIHSIIRNLADNGLTVLMISSDMSEVLTVSDRIIVMREGEISAEILGSDATEEKIIFSATK